MLVSLCDISLLLQDCFYKGKMTSPGSSVAGPRNRTCEDCKLPGPDLQCHASDYLLCKPCRMNHDSAFASSESNGESHDTIVKERVETSSQNNQPIVSACQGQTTASCLIHKYGF